MSVAAGLVAIGLGAVLLGRARPADGVPVAQASAQDRPVRRRERPEAAPASRAAVTTARSDPDPSFPPAETLLLDAATWGTDLPNVLKGHSVAWDGTSLWTFGIATGRVAAIDPAVGHPIATVDLDVPGHTIGTLRADPTRKRLWWVNRQDGGMRVIDTESRMVLASREGTRAEHAKAYPYVDAALDPATGALWVVNRRSPTVVAYDARLTEVDRLEGLTAPESVAVSPDGRTIAVFDAASEGETHVVRRTAGVVNRQTVGTRGRGTRILFLADGTLVEAGRELTARAADGTKRWSTKTPALPADVVATRDAIAVLYTGGPADAPSAEALVVLYDPATGAERARTSVRYEAKFLDSDGARVFVGNGGDGSISVIDARTGSLVATWDAGNAAEQVLVDPLTGIRYVLDRLGGSTLYRWAPGSKTVKPIPLGGWPTEMAIDGRTLVILGHHRSALLRLGLDDGARLADLPLGVPPNRTDTLGDLDVSGGLAAVVFPESGSIALADLRSGTIRWTRTEADQRAGERAGPGEGNVVIDTAHDRLYTWGGGRVRAFALKDGSPLGSLDVPRAEGRAYHINPLLLDRDRLFVGPQEVKVPALALGGRLSGAMKVFWAGPDALLGLDPGGPRQPEELVELDPRTLQERRSWPLVATGMMRLTATYDAASKRVYVTDMAEARVLAWNWP